MSHKIDEIDEILENVITAAKLATDSLEEINSRDPNRAHIALRNFITTSRSITFIVQNLKGKVPLFSEWYEPFQKGLRDDPICRNFVELRNRIEKRGQLFVSYSTRAHGNFEDAKKELGPPPPNVVSYFFGDELGGSGWEVSYGSGTYKVYSANALTVAKTTTHLQNVTGCPENNYLEEQPISEICNYHMRRMQDIVDAAVSQFGTSRRLRGSLGSRASPVWLQVVKGKK